VLAPVGRSARRGLQSLPEEKMRANKYGLGKVIPIPSNHTFLRISGRLHTRVRDHGLEPEVLYRQPAIDQLLQGIDSDAQMLVEELLRDAPVTRGGLDPFRHHRLIGHQQ